MCLVLTGLSCILLVRFDHHLHWRSRLQRHLVAGLIQKLIVNANLSIEGLPLFRTISAFSGAGAKRGLMILSTVPVSLVLVLRRCFAGCNFALLQ